MCWTNQTALPPTGSHADGAATSFNRLSGVLRRVLGLGSVVMITFGVLWAPFCLFRDDDSEDGSDAQSGCLSSMGQVS